METNPSVRRLMLRAYALGQRIWPRERDVRRYTRPQLFACLAVREALRLSYRRAEAFLRDVPAWLAQIDWTADQPPPDHNTLWRAFGTLLGTRRMSRALDLLAADDAQPLSRELRRSPLAIDSTCFEPRHRSGHYDRVCRKMQQRTDARNSAKPPGKWGAKVNRSRARKTRGMPKLALAVAAASHRILAARATIGNGSDAPDFEPLLFDASRRAAVRTVVADAGYDSEANHQIARQDMRVRSIMPATIGRPSAAPPSGRYRRLMHQRFARGADAAVYGQRAQAETVNSMIKRNLGEHLRSIKPQRRKQEMLFRPVVHYLMLEDG